MAISPKVSAAGTVIAWGDNSSGQTNVPSDLEDVVAVAAGYRHSLALREDGRVVAWGDNTYGQANVPPGLSNVVAIAGSLWHSIALRNDGTVIAWGNNTSGQTNVPANLTNVTAIAAGRDFSAALRRDSTIVVWGETIHVGWSDILAIAAGNFIVALRNDGTVISQGVFPYPVPASVTNTIAVSAAADSLLGGRAMALQADGTVIGWQLPQGPTNAPSNVSNAVGIAAGPSRSAILSEAGQVLEWYYSQAAVATRYSNVCAIAAGSAHFLAIQTTSPCVTLQPQSQTAFVGKPITLHARAAGTPQLYYQWYYNSNVLAGATNASLSITSAQITNSGAYVCVISNLTGAVTTSVAQVTVVPVAAWGNNINGQAQIFPELSNVVAVAAGESHSLGIRADGTVIGWGDNSSGKATPPPGLQNVIAIAAGGTHSLALKQDGTVTAWGANDVGQTNVPPSATNIIAIAAGTAHSLALRADGSVVAWGDGRFDLTNRASSIRDAVQIAVAGMQNIILRRDGTHLAWGNEYFTPLLLTLQISSLSPRRHLITSFYGRTAESLVGVLCRQ